MLIAGKHADPPESPEQDIFCRPSADPAQFHQLFRAALRRDSIQQFDPDGERELLTSDDVNQCLENARKPRWLETAKLLDKWRQAPVAHGELVKGLEICSQPQRTSQQLRDRGSYAQFYASGYGDGQLRVFARANLPSRYFERHFVDHQYAAVGTAVPAIDDVAGATAQRPNSQIQPERWNWAQAET